RRVPPARVLLARSKGAAGGATALYKRRRRRRGRARADAAARVLRRRTATHLSDVKVRWRMTLDLPLQTVVSLFAAFSPAEPSEVSGEIGRASDLIGAEVVDAKDEAHAEIVDLMIDAERERVACAVVRC